MKSMQNMTNDSIEQFEEIEKQLQSDIQNDELVANAVRHWFTEREGTDIRMLMLMITTYKFRNVNSQ